MKTTTFLSRIEKENNCELRDVYSEFLQNGVSRTTYEGKKDTHIIIAEKNGKLLSCKEFDLVTEEETIIYQAK